MTKIILFNKPYGVLSQFSPSPPHQCLKDYIKVPQVYPAGRLDADSEGLLILTNNGKLQAQICEPRQAKFKTYLLQVEGIPCALQLQSLELGVNLTKYTTLPAQARLLTKAPRLWERYPPIRVRQNLPTSWLLLAITEGKNRQVRRMTAKVGLPTLRLIRVAIGGIGLGSLAPGSWREMNLAQFTKTFNQSLSLEYS